jgi:hypothetical protein
MRTVSLCRNQGHLEQMTKVTESSITRITDDSVLQQKAREHRLWILNPQISMTRLAGQFAEELTFVHAVFESFAAVDEDDGDFVVELAAELVVGVDVDFLPDETTAAGEFHDTFLDDFTQVTALAGVDEDFAGDVHM